MKKNSYKQFAVSLVMLLITSVLFTSCHLRDKKINCFSVSKSFEETNWNYDQRIVEFEVELESSDLPRKISINLDLTQKLVVDKLPLTFSIYAPSGAASHKPVVFYFSQYPELDSQEPFSSKIVSTTIYPQKFFSESGTYRIRLLQKSTKYDLYGVNSVTIRSENIDKQKDKED